MEAVLRWQEDRLLKLPAEAEALKKKAEEEATARAQVCYEAKIARLEWWM